MSENLISEDREILISYLVMEARMCENPSDMPEIEEAIIDDVLSMSDREVTEALEEIYK